MKNRVVLVLLELLVLICDLLSFRINLPVRQLIAAAPLLNQSGSLPPVLLRCKGLQIK